MSTPVLSIPIGSPVSPQTQTVIGDLVITGDVIVEGHLTAISGGTIGIDLETADRSFTLNTPCSGAGVPGDGIAGVFIDRGSLAKTSMVFNENTDSWQVHYAGSADQTVMLRSTTPVSGAIPFGNTVYGYTHDDANLHWDDTNNRLGVGTNTPANPLDVVGIASATTVSVGKTTNSGYAVDVKASATNPTLALSLDGYPTTSASSALRMRSRDVIGTEMKNDIVSSSANGGTFQILDNAGTQRISLNPNRFYLNFKRTGGQSLMDVYDSTLTSGDYVRRRLGGPDTGGATGASLTETFYYNSTATSCRGNWSVEGYESKGLQVNSIGVGVGVTPTKELHIKNTVGVTTALVDFNDATKMYVACDISGGYVGTITNNPVNLVVNNSVKAVIMTDGKFGLGITSPDADLHIKKTGSATLRIETSDDQYAIVQHKTPTSSLWQTLVSPTNDYRIGIGSVGDFLTVKSTGYVGIGTTDPKSLFHIKQTQDDNHAGAVKITRFDTGTDTFNIQVGQGNNLHIGYSATTTGTPDISAQMQLSSTGNLGIGGTASATNKLKVNGNTETDGIAFPATQVPSADVNTLDDYQEGVWTPELEFYSLQTGSFTYTVQSGYYTKIGNTVHFECKITWTAIPSGGSFLSVIGLPFQPNTNTYATTPAPYSDVTTGTWSVSGPQFGAINGSLNRIFFYKTSTGSVVSFAYNQIPSSATLNFSGTYRV